MRKSLCRGALRALPLLLLAVFMAVQAQAVPLTTKYYSLDLPADWVVVSGPVKVQEAIQQQNAKYFCGCTLSSTALAVGKEVDKGAGVFITPAGADEITSTECNRATFRWTVPTYGAIQQTVRPVFEANPSAKRWYTITPQYVFGEALLSAAKNLFAELGIEHVGNSYHSTQEQEYSGYLTNAMAAKPDVLLLLGFGGNGDR